MIFMKRYFFFLSINPPKPRRRTVAGSGVTDKIIYTVGQVNTLIKQALQNNLPGRLSINGEISNWKAHSSGHCYFSLKDENSVLPCVMWNSSFKKLKFQPESGIAITATGYIDVYPPQGKYQFYAESMKPAGEGGLQLAFEQLAAKLKAEGLFDDEYKKLLPPYPQKIVIITSETGAAVHDIADSIFNRYKCAKLYLYPCPVQGDGADEKLADAVKKINIMKLNPDIIIIGRGGGSAEDLWEFNSEALARAIFESKIPVISAVGHEIDITISDLVADARASTPTKAGLIAVPDINEILDRLLSAEKTLSSQIRWHINICSEKIETITASSAFKNPLRAVRDRTQQVDELQARGKSSIDDIIDNYKMTLKAQHHRLKALDPKSVLNRGYSITTVKKTGKLLKNIKDIKTSDILITELSGKKLVESEVKNVQNTQN